MKKVLRVIVITMIIITLTMANFIAIGVNMVSYAAELITQDVRTNYKNVEFAAYFKDATGTKLRAIEESIAKEDIKLYMEVEVKQEGYFNGEITLDSGNFKLKPEKLSEGINKIEGNKIILNQINAGQKVAIEVGIEQIKDEQFDLGLLNMQSKISISGTYKDSTEKDINIATSKIVELDLVSPFTSENEGAELKYKLLTDENTVYNNENKRIIQFLIESGITNNAYPIKSSKIEMDVPELEEQLPEEVKVSSKGTLATNGNNNYEMSANSWKYDKATKKLTLEVTNEVKDNKITWKKSGKDQYVVTFIYDEQETELNKANMNINSVITLYDSKVTELKAKAEMMDGETEGLINIYSKEAESSIYKGKIYSKIEREIKSLTKVDVNLENVAEEIYIEDKTETMLQNSNNPEGFISNSNINYKTTILNKTQLTNILGEDFVVEILNARDNTQIAKITKDTGAEQNENIVITYPENIQAIAIKTSKPQKVGKIELVNTKTIKGTEKEIAKLATKIDTTVQGKYTVKGNETKINANVSSIKLEEPQTTAKLEVSRSNLSTVVENKGVEIKTVLQSNKEANDLYKNPTIKLELPEQVTEVKVNSIKVLYEDQIQVSDAKSFDENGKKVISLRLNGEQTNYTDTAIEGITVIINADIKLDRKAASAERTVKLTYTNENATTYKNGSNVGQEEVPMSIVSPKGLIAINNIESLGVETIGDSSEKSVMLEKGKVAKNVKVESELINNNDSSISNVAILGTFPTNESKIDNKTSNMATKITSEVKVEGADAKVYYSEKADATSELSNSSNAWKETIENNEKVKKYLVVLNSMENTQAVKASYDVEIPGNLEYNEEAYTGYSVNYLNTSTGLQQTAKSTTINAQTGVGPVLESSLLATVGGKQISSGDEVKTGEVIRYQITLKNTGTEDATNVKVSGQVPEGTVYVEPEDAYEYTGASYYNEIEKQIHEMEIGTIKAGETVTKSYEVRVNNETADGKPISNKMTTYYGEAKQETNEIQNIVSAGNLRVTVKRTTDRQIELAPGRVLKYYAIIENTSNITQENIKVHANVPEDAKIVALGKYEGVGKIDASEKEDTIATDSDGIEYPVATKENAGVQYEELEIAEDVTIGSIAAGKNVILEYSFEIDSQIEEASKDIKFTVDTVDSSNLSYRSNLNTEIIHNIDLSVTLTSEQNGNTLKTGDKVIYKLVIKNNSNIETGLISIEDILPEQLDITAVKKDGTEVSVPDDSKVYIDTVIPKNTTTEIEIDTNVGYSIVREEPEVISNKARVLHIGELVQETAEITNIVEAEEDAKEQGGSNNPDDSNNPNNPGTPEKQGYMISGTAWLDKNTDGKRDSDEQLLSGIKVRLLDTQTDAILKDTQGNEISAITSEKGVYLFQNIPSGSYMVVFEYDTSIYGLTAYQKEGIAESDNSDVIAKQLNIDGIEKNYGVTDKIEISDNNKTNINIGLTELKNFDLKLDKYVSKITVQSNKGTSSYAYNEAQLAKVEIHSKEINGATVVVEYAIKVTNCGEVDAYANKIVDYLSNDFKFSSEMNKDWYQSNGYIYNSSLANQKIPAGESRILTLVVTKAMTEDNTGRINNTAEIAEQYNELGFEDNNSTPGNKAQGENDMSSADVIISIKTGATTYVTIILTIIITSALIAYFILKINKKENL